MMVEEKIKDWYYAHFMSNIGCRICFKHSSFCASFADFHLRNGEVYFYSNLMPSDYCDGLEYSSGAKSVCFWQI